MPTLQQQIAEKFLAKLAESKSSMPRRSNSSKVCSRKARSRRLMTSLRSSRFLPAVTSNDQARIRPYRGSARNSQARSSISGKRSSRFQVRMDRARAASSTRSNSGSPGKSGGSPGRGTKGLSVSEHGPHVDKTKFPDAAFVELRVFLTGIGKSATITRKVSSPKKPKIEPADDDVKAALAEIADHPEITLSRREILRFILVEPTKRSEEIQTILKLDDIGQTRGALEHRSEQASDRAARPRLRRCRSSRRCPATASSDRDAAARTICWRPSISGGRCSACHEIAELTADTKLDAGLSTAAKPSDFNKESALRDLKALADAAKGFPDLAKTEAAAIVADLAKLEADPALLAALQRRVVHREGPRTRRRTRVSALRHAVGGRAAPPRPLESEIGEIGGSAEASRVPAEERHRDRRGSHTGSRPSGAGPEARGRARTRARSRSC